MDYNKVDLTNDMDALMHERAAFFHDLAQDCDNDPIGLLAEFCRQVKENSAVDVKNQKEWQFQPNMKYYYDGTELRKDDVGNILFGYVGAQLYPLAFLQSGAGVCQVYKQTSSWSYYDSYFDDPRDTAMIKLGYTLYWKEHGR